MDFAHIAGAAFAGVTTYLKAHAILAYVVLFLGSYFETLIGVGFFVYGELFFIPGALLAGAHVLNVWILTFALISGGVLGDSSSYLIGKKYGVKAFKEGNKHLNPKAYKKGQAFFHRYGVKAIFFARLLGPLSWITPFLAGIYHVPYRTFLKYNIPGVTVGIGEFIIAGYFFGNTYQQIFDFIQHYIEIILGIIAALIIIYLAIKRFAPEVIAEMHRLWREEKKKLLALVLQYTGYFIAVVIAIYLLFLGGATLLDSLNL